MLPFLLLSMASLDTLSPKAELITFHVINRNSKIGYINIEKQSQAEAVTYTLNSNIKAKILFKFNAIAEERSVYEHDTLVFSSIYRTLNNKVNRNQSLALVEGRYILSYNDQEEILPIDCIRRNLVTLYFKEPIGISMVFCDNQKQMVKVAPISEGIYKVEFSKGKYNIFHYKEGKCVKVEAVSPMFDVTLIPAIL
ncbi:DUF6134 family protein [Flavobacteriaceae bacterium LMO-SS05]